MLIVCNFNFYIYLVFVSRKIKVKFDFGHYVKQKKSHPTVFFIGSSFCFHILSSYLFCFVFLSLFSCFVQVLYERLGGCYFFSSLILFIFCTKLAKSLVIILLFNNLL
jgi:hypothetical protein